MDDSGVLALSMMEAVFEKSVLVEEDKPKEEESTLSKLGSTISKLFAGERYGMAGKSGGKWLKLVICR